MLNFNNKVRFGIIGTNFITDTVINAARFDQRFEATAVYSRTEDRAKEFALKHDIPHTFTSLDAMAESSLIDAVYIASPNYCHAQQSILFMKHGKHVLCEKPFASNSREVKEMIAASKKYNVTLMEAMKSTLTPVFIKLLKQIEEIGIIRRYFSCYCQYSSRYDKLKEGTVLNAFNPSFSNGSVMDLGIYTIYPMVILFGKPNKISATGLLLSTGADGQGAVNFEYKDMNGTVIYSKIADSNLPTEIQGEAGIISVDRINSITNLTLTLRDGVHKILNQPTNQPEYFYEIEEFINLIFSGRRESNINSHQNSLITIEIIDEIRKQLHVVFPADKKG